MLTPINDFGNFSDVLYEYLLEIYTQKEWEMSWHDFLCQAEKEIQYYVRGWEEQAQYEQEEEEES